MIDTIKALRAHTRGGPQSLVYESAPSPIAGTGDVVVEVRAASYTPGELAWPSTWIRSQRSRPDSDRPVSRGFRDRRQRDPRDDRTGGWG